MFGLPCMLACMYVIYIYILVCVHANMCNLCTCICTYVRSYVGNFIFMQCILCILCLLAGYLSDSMCEYPAIKHTNFLIGCNQAFGCYTSFSLGELTGLAHGFFGSCWYPPFRWLMCQRRLRKTLHPPQLGCAVVSSCFLTRRTASFMEIRLRIMAAGC